MKRLLIITAAFTLIWSCVKMPDGEIIRTIDNLTIPEGFDWKTVKDLSVTVNVTSDGQTTGLHIIRIYNSPLLTEGSLIATGGARPEAPYTVKLTVATSVPTLYIHETKPNGLVKVTQLLVTAPNLITTLQASAGNAPGETAGMFKANASFTSPDIAVPANYDVTINNNNALNITGFNTGESSAYGNTYKSFIIPAGFTRTETITFNSALAHAVLYVAGTLNISRDNLALNRASIVVLNGGTVNIQGISNGGNYTTFPPVLVIKSGGSMKVAADASFSNGAVVVNKGSFTAEGTRTDLIIDSGSKLYNEGTMSISGSRALLNVTNSSQAYNSGTINSTEINLTVTATWLNDTGSIVNVGTWYQSNGTVLNNYGEISATVQFGNSGGGTINNFCRIAALHTSFQAVTLNMESGSLINTGTMYVNNSTMVMAGQSMFLTGNITEIYGMNLSSSSTLFSVFKCTGNIPDMRWAASTIKGNIEFVHEKLTTGIVPNGRDLYSASFSNGAILTNTQTKNITGTTCNGSLGQIEAPGGGGGETTEFSSYFPSQSGWASYAFEDQWPAKGDYDLNDIVTAFRVTFISNASNQITELRFRYKIQAVGATRTLSAAFQLDNVNASNIQSVTGQILGGNTPFATSSNGSEQGVTKAVIPVFNNVKNVVNFTSMFLNTVEGESYISSDENQVVVKFVTPVAQSQLTMASLNFFIVVDARGKEIHLPGFHPTTSFNQTYAAGASLYSGDYFKYADGMMWGLMFAEQFSYPQEKKSILDAYTHFASWATSGGTNYTDWYQDKSGYRNMEKIY